MDGYDIIFYWMIDMLVNWVKLIVGVKGLLLIEVGVVVLKYCVVVNVLLELLFGDMLVDYL